MYNILYIFNTACREHFDILSDLAYQLGCGSMDCKGLKIILYLLDICIDKLKNLKS